MKRKILVNDFLCKINQYFLYNKGKNAFFQNKTQKVCSGSADTFHLVLEVIAVAQGSILHLGAIIVDGVDGVVQEFCNLRTVLNTQSDKCENADVGVQLLWIAQLYLLVFA